MIISTNVISQEIVKINMSSVFNGLNEYKVINKKLNDFIDLKNKKLKKTQDSLEKAVSIYNKNIDNKNIDLELLKKRISYFESVKKTQKSQFKQEILLKEKELKKPFVNKVVKKIKSFGVKKKDYIIIDSDSLIYYKNKEIRDISLEFINYYSN